MACGLAVGGRPRSCSWRRTAALFILLLPPSAPAVAQACGGSTVPLTGSVEAAEEGVRLPGVIVAIRAADEDAFSTEVVTAVDGTFATCVPTGVGTLTAWAELGGLAGEPVAVSRRGEHREPLVLVIPVSTGAPGNVGMLREGISPGAIGELGEVRGRLIEIETAQPVVGGRIAVAGTSTVSDETGGFILEGVAPGRHVVRIERLGYKLLEDSLLVEAGHVTGITAELAREAMELEPLFVSVVQNPRLDRVGFYERKTLGERLGLGRYLTREDIERRNPARVSDFLDSISLLDMLQSCGGTCRKLPRLRGAAPRMSGRFGSVPCPADVFVDGRPVRLFRWGDDHELIVVAGIDEFVLPADIEAVEVYRRASELPARFGGPTDGCGAVVIWTR